jgi:hypothetical protein
MLFANFECAAYNNMRLHKTLARFRQAASTHAEIDGIAEGSLQSVNLQRWRFFASFHT